VTDAAAPLKVLVVDDEPMVMRAELRVLESAGHVCFGARSAAEAIATLRREPIDVVVSDLRMPGEDGIALARAMHRSHPQVPLIMVTGVADFSSVTAARSAGAVDYIVKPVLPADLLAVVNRAGRSTGAPASDGGSAVSASPAIDRLFRAMVEVGASDLHLSTSMPPLVRKDGEIVPLDTTAAALGGEDVIRLIDPIIPGKNRREFEEGRDSDFVYELAGLARFRGNVFMDRKGVGAVFRTVPARIMTAEEIGLPPSVLELCELRKGLVLVTGSAGSGKSTTLAALINHINATRSDHIVTIEDPIEFVYENQRCFINQREVYTHTRSYKTALHATLREDPDVVLIGEMRDLETVSIALETAETGHLVFATLPTTTAVSTVDRIIDQFPAERQAQVRVMLSDCLKGVIAQTLCRRIGGGRVAAMEIMLVDAAIANLIRESRTFQIGSVMQTGQAAGNVTLNDALTALVRDGMVTPEEAMTKAVDKPAFAATLARP